MRRCERNPWRPSLRRCLGGLQTPILTWYDWKTRVIQVPRDLSSPLSSIAYEAQSVKCLEKHNAWSCFQSVISKVVSTHLWNTALNLYQQAIFWDSFHNCLRGLPGVCSRCAFMDTTQYTDVSSTTDMFDFFVPDAWWCKRYFCVFFCDVWCVMCDVCV